MLRLCGSNIELEQQHVAVRDCVLLAFHPIEPLIARGGDGPALDEIVVADGLIECGSIAAARDKGLYRMEGKEYTVADGDVLLFKFNV